MGFRSTLAAARPLFLALSIYLAVAAVYVWIVPPLEGFDSIPHQNYVNYLRHAGHLPRIEAEAAVFSYQTVQHPPLYYLVSAALTLPWEYADWGTHVRARENVYFGTLSDRWSVDLPNPPPGLRASLWIARGVSLLGGVLAVVGAWLWTRTVLYRVEESPTEKSSAASSANLAADATDGMAGFGLAAVLLFALNPLFLFISTTITNDSWAVMAAVWVMWLTTLLARNPQSPRWRWATLGVVAGAAALIKYSVLVLILPVGFLLVLAYRHHLGRLALGTAIAVTAASAVAGYWYFRNLMLYGELIPWTRLAEVISTIEREQTLSWSQVLSSLDWLFYSYWGVFVAIFAPEPFFAFWKWFALICAVGLLIALARAPKASWRMRVGPALIWLVGVVAATLYWARTVSYGEQARLALIAGPALALLLSLGWRALLPRRAVKPVAWLLVAVFIGVSLWPVPTLRAAYRVPPPIDADIGARASAAPTYQPVGMKFAPGMELVGYELPQGRVLAERESLPLVLYWRATQAIAQDYTLFVHIADADDTIWYQYDGVPAQGRHTTRQWQPGETFAMRLDLALDATAAQALTQPGALATQSGALATLSVGFYVHDDPEARVTIESEVENGQTAQDRVLLGEVRYLPAEFSDGQHAVVPPRPLAAWENGIVLEYAATEFDAASGQLWLETAWNTGSLVAENLSVFVHMVDAQGEIVVQTDGEPVDGNAPTTTWTPGEQVADRYLLEVPPPVKLAQDGPFYLLIGWYDVQTGDRVARAGASDHADYLRLQVE